MVDLFAMGIGYVLMLIGLLAVSFFAGVFVYTTAVNGFVYMILCRWCAGDMSHRSAWAKSMILWSDFKDGATSTATSVFVRNDNTGRWVSYYNPFRFKRGVREDYKLRLDHD